MGDIPYHLVKDLIEEEIKKYQSGAGETKFPPIEFERKEGKTEIKFQLQPKIDLYSLIMEITKNLGEMNIENSMGSTTLRKDPFRIWIYAPYPGYRSFSFHTNQDFSSEEVEAIIKAYQIGNPIENAKSPQEKLKELGVTIYTPDNALDWDYLAGYDSVKQEIKETIILSLKHPEVYKKIAEATRKKYETNRPKAVLFEGPPGTGKTTAARIIAKEIEAPLIYVPIESIMTKWYGESERNLAAIFNGAEELGETILFLDEIDSLAASREREMHEATRRVLSVLLRKIDGFETENRTILIGATNRKNDLDSALLSRFDVSISFPLPNTEERKAIFENYAKHLTPIDLETLANKSEGISGRNIKDVCEYAERRLASKIIASGNNVTLPTVLEYLTSLKVRVKNGI